MRPDKTGMHEVHQNKVGVLLPRVKEEARFQAKKREGARGAPGYVLSLETRSEELDGRV